MNSQAAFLLSKALESIRSSSLPTAMLYLSQALKIQSNNSECLRLIGVVHALNGEHHEALTKFDQAISLSPRSGVAYSNKGNALQELGRFEDAILCYNKAISLMPNYHEAHNNKGNALKGLGRFEDAILCYDKAISLMPNYHEVHNNKGNALQELGRFEDAILCYDKAISLMPNYHEAHNNKGNALQEQGRFEDAILCYDKAISLMPNYHEAHINKGNALQEQGRFEDAILCYDKAISYMPNYHKAHNNKGNALKGLGRFEDAILCYDKAISLMPNYPEPYSNKGLIFFELRQIEKARVCYENALKINPTHINSKYNLSHLELQEFNFTEGWLNYENRWLQSDFDSPRMQTSRPQWLGDFKDQRLFVWSEQGIGDQILYSSMLKELDGLAGKKIVSLDKKLIKIFERSFPNYYFVSKEDFVLEQDFDVQIPMGNLGVFFRRSLESFNKAKHPYIFDDAARTQSIKSQHKFLNTITCGISWGSTNIKVGDHKSIPIHELYPILRMKSIEFINLQYGDVSSSLLQVKEDLSKEIFNLDEINVFDDVDGALSIISACNIIVTCSNTTAHLAGALGKETLLLVPYSAGQFWYWHAIDGKSIWYPSVKVFKQERQGDWSLPVQAVKKYLETRFG